MIADALRNNTQLKTLWLGVRDAMAMRSLARALSPDARPRAHTLLDVDEQHWRPWGSSDRDLTCIQHVVD